MTMTMELHDHARSRADSAARELRRTEERIAEGEQRRRERESEYALRLSEERRLRETTRTAVIVAAAIVAASALTVAVKTLGLF
jgi:hypothetical protein